MNIFHSVIKTCKNVLFYGIVYSTNIILSIITKVVFKDMQLSTNVTYKNNRIRYRLSNNECTFSNSLIKEGSFKDISLQITRRFESIIKIKDLKLILNKINNTPTDTSEEICWKNNYYNLDKDIENLGIIKKQLSNIHIIIYSLELYYERDNDFKVYMSNISIQRHRDNDDIIIQLGRIKIYYKGLFIGSLNKTLFKIKDDGTGLIRKFIDIRKININLFTKILFNNFIDRLYEIYEDVSVEGSEPLPYCNISSIRINVYLLNYIQLNCKNVMINNETFKIDYLLGKIWKKDSIWLNDLIVHLNDEHRPEIKHLRIRLFTSTSDKLYKSFIILRKKFYPIHERPKNVKQVPLFPHNNIVSSYIQDMLSKHHTENIYKNEHVDITNADIDNKYVIELSNIAMRTKLFIKFIQIDLSYDGGKIVADEVSINTDDIYNYMYITNWVFYKQKKKYISKYNSDSSEQCIFKFNNDVMDITPYKLIIFLDTKQYSYSFNIIKDNIARLTQLFSSNFYYYNRGYIFERFYMRSFYAGFSYKKRSMKMGKLIEGNKMQLLNCLKINDLDLILKEVNIFYPINWDQVIKKIISVYAHSIYEYNIDSIIKKVAGPKAATIINLKRDFKSLRKKIKNFKYT